MNKLLKVGIYLRLSDEDRNKLNKYDDSESIKNQRCMLMEYIDNNSQFIFFDEYCDEDLSGAGTFRPEFERLIRDCQDGKIDVVLCKSQSRFSRDMEIIERYVNNKFREWGIRFISLSDNADTENPGNKKSRQINGLVNEWYLEDVSNNIRAAFNAKMKQGEFISPFAPYGYDVCSSNNNKLVIDNDASKIVRDIFLLYLKGYGFTGIAKYLNNKRIACPSLYKYQKGIKLNVVSSRRRDEIKWTTTAIKTILTNEVYLGNLIQGKRTTVSYKNHKIINKNKDKWIKVENTHDAIIDVDLFNKVQDEIKKRTKSRDNLGIIHNFSGKVYCFECGCYLRKKNSSKYQYLVCSNNYNGYDDCVNKKGIRYDKLEEIILNIINSKIEKYFDIVELDKLDKLNNKNNYVNKITLLEKRKGNINKKILDINKYLKNLYEDKVNGDITLEQFRLLVDDYNNAKELYDMEIKSIDKDIFLYKNKMDNNKMEIFSKYNRLDKLNRIIVNEFIDKIYVGKIDKENNKRNIYIKWNFFK